jgi:soluble lytic murein transglycosylase-like protein
MRHVALRQTIRQTLITSALFAVAWPGCALAQDVQRFQCTLIDGSVHLFVEDMTIRQPTMTSHCDRVQLPRAGRVIEPGGSAAGLAERLASLVTVIESRTPMLQRAPASMPAELATLVRSAAARYRLDEALVSALIFVESRYRPDARSPKGALGLMQLMPDTAARYGVKSARDLLDPQINVDIGTRHLQSLHTLYGGQVDLMLAAYNAGEGAVRRYGNRVPPYPETEAYVQQIMAMSRARR